MARAGITALLAACVGVFVSTCQEDGGTCSHCSGGSSTTQVVWADGVRESIEYPRMALKCEPSQVPDGGPMYLGDTRCFRCNDLTCTGLCVCFLERTDAAAAPQPTTCACAMSLDTAITPSTGCRDGLVCAMGRCIPENSPGEWCTR
jgi:hypothetical protein